MLITTGPPRAPHGPGRLLTAQVAGLSRLPLAAPERAR
ncbi:hypothetical protein BH23ACT7_BH23ACT7_25740 [soil metagenome]|jgi:hypothetical protein